MTCGNFVLHKVNNGNIYQSIIILVSTVRDLKFNNFPPVLALYPLSPG